ncbi:MAG: hypothetical protein WAO91_02935 [Candidatus Nitrosotenuis sp.]
MKKIPGNILITFVSRDTELNKIGIRELITNRKYGGFSRIYLFYDSRMKGSSPLDGWAELSVTSKQDLATLFRSLKLEIKEVGVNPNNIVESYKEVIVKESKDGNTVYIDATSLRRITIAKISYLAVFFDLKIFLVVPDKLYEPKNAFIMEGGKMTPLNEWAAKQEGRFEMVDIPRMGYPKLRKISIRLIKALSDHGSRSTKILLTKSKLRINDQRLRDNLRKLNEMGIIIYKKEGKFIKDIELTTFGKLMSDLL